MRLAVLGSGGIGGYYGALLAKGGHDVAFIARGPHLETLQQRGLTVRTPEGESTIPVTAVADTRSLAPVDLVLFFVKWYDTEPAAQALAPLMARDTRSGEHTSELQSLAYLVCRLLLEKKKIRHPRYRGTRGSIC